MIWNFLAHLKSASGQHWPVHFWRHCFTFALKLKECCGLCHLNSSREELLQYQIRPSYSSAPTEPALKMTLEMPPGRGVLLLWERAGHCITGKTNRWPARTCAATPLISAVITAREMTPNKKAIFSEGDNILFWRGRKQETRAYKGITQHCAATASQMQ